MPKPTYEMSREELEAEVNALRKEVTGYCPTCRKWAMYMGSYDEDGYTRRCHGCLISVGSCTCR